MISKAKRLIELVKGKTLLREAPLKRDLILELYDFDIDNEMNKREKTDIPGECPALARYKVIKNFENLVIYVRKKSDAIADKSEDSESEYAFYLLEDEDHQRRCVHIRQGWNNDYLLKRNRMEEKAIENSKRRMDHFEKVTQMSQELRDTMRDNEIKNRWKRNLLQKYCTPKQIRALVVELRRDKKLPEHRKDYRPNIKGIRHEFAKNASEIKLVMYKASDVYMDNTSGFDKENARKSVMMKTYQNSDEIIKNMTKEIILCDYEKRDYELLEPQEPDYLGIKNK